MDRKEFKSELEQLLLQKSGQNSLNAVQTVFIDIMADKLDEYRQASDCIRDEGMMTVSAGRKGDIIKKNPAIDASDLSMKALILMAKELGIAEHHYRVQDGKDAADQGFNPLKRPGG